MRKGYLTRVQKAVYEEASFSTIIDKMEEIDYKLEKYGESLDALYRMKESAQKANNYDELQSINEKLAKDYKVSFNEMAAILMRKLLEHCEINEINIGYINGRPHVFNGKYWKAIEQAIFTEFLSEIALKTGIKDYISKQNGKKGILLDQFISEAIITSKSNEKIKINLVNGTYVLDPKNSLSAELLEHNPNDGLTYVLEFGYDPNAKAPLFTKFLNRILPDKPSQEVVLQFIAYCLTNLNLEKMLFALGNGANGKSTIINIIKRLLGENNLSFYTAQKLTDDSGYTRAQVAGKLLNCSPEFGSRNVDYETLKKMVSNEKVDARSPYKSPFEFTFNTKLWFNLNSLPYVESILAIRRRILLVPFTVTIPKEEQNPNLEDDICKNELPGIFNMILDALKQLVDQKGFTQSDAIDNAVDAYMRDNDNVRIFMEESNYVKSVNQKILMATLYQTYRIFCQENGYSPCSKNKFSERLKKIGYEVRPSNQNGTYVFCIQKFTLDEEYNKNLDESDLSPIDKILRYKSVN